MIDWQLMKWLWVLLGLHETLVSYLTLWLCLTFALSLGTETFLLGSFMILSHIKWLCICFYLTFGYLNESSLFCFPTFFDVFQYSSMHLSRESFWETKLRNALVSSMCDEWLRQELRDLRLSRLSSYVICAWLYQWLTRGVMFFFVILSVFCNMSLGLWMCRCWVRWGGWQAMEKVKREVCAWWWIRSGEGRTYRLVPNDQEAKVRPWAARIGHIKEK